MARVFLVLVCSFGIAMLSLPLPEIWGLSVVAPPDQVRAEVELQIGETVHGHVASDTITYTVRSDTSAYVMWRVTVPDDLEWGTAGMYFESAAEYWDFILPVGEMAVFLDGGETYHLSISSSSSAGLDYTIELQPITGVLRETEPNDDPAGATSLALGEAAIGATAPGYGSDDYYTFTAGAGDVVAVEVTSARGIPPPLVSLELTTPDGVLQGEKFSSAYFSSRDTSRVLYTASSGGPLTARARARFGWGWYWPEPSESALGVYRISVAVLPPGPGDPTTIVWDGAGAPSRVAVGPAGEVYILDAETHRILRWDPTGTHVVYDDATSPLRDVVVHPSGDLLVATGDGTHGQVLRVSSSGSELLLDQRADRLVVAPNGHLCLGSWGGIRCFDMGGRFVDELLYGLEGWLSDMAFSPSGTLYFVRERSSMDGWGGGWTVEKWTPDSPVQRMETVFEIPGEELHSIAFDAEGRLYVGTRTHGVRRVAPGQSAPGELVAVQNLHTATSLAFGRSSDGSTTKDLYATNRAMGRLVQLNAAGIPAPGAPVGPSFLDIPLDRMLAALFGEADALTAEEARWVDQVGNGNGQVDVGDLAALLHGDWIGSQ